MYICKSVIRESGKIYQAGDHYTGMYSLELVQAGALEKIADERDAPVEMEAPKTEPKNKKKKKG